MRGNRATTSLKPRRRNEDPMRDYDRLPAELRAWRATAVLPWRPRWVRRAFDKALAETGDRASALTRLTALQTRLVAKDAAAVWGPEHPAVQDGQLSGQMPFSVTPREISQLRRTAIASKPSSVGRLRDTIWKRAVSVHCALALMLVGAGYRPAETEPRLSDPQIAAYLSLGGSLADLCLSGDDGQDHAAPAHCPACTIAKTMALAPACLALSDLVVGSIRRAVWPETLVLTGHGPRAPPARGPPFLQLI